MSRHDLTSSDNFFESFTVGETLVHSRGRTIGDEQRAHEWQYRQGYVERQLEYRRWVSGRALARWRSKLDERHDDRGQRDVVGRRRADE